MTSLFGYHGLRDRERRQWKRHRPAAAVAPADRDSLAARVAGLISYSDEQEEDLVHVSPVPADRAASRLCSAYRQGTDGERAFLRSRIREHHGYILLTFSKRTATRGYQAKAVGPIRQALIALAVEDLSAGDVRDDLIALGLIYYCAAKVGADLPALFEDVARKAGPAIAGVLREFLDGDDPDDMLDGMGFKRAQSRGKTGFRWIDD
jgi:hypothetical protein